MNEEHFQKPFQTMELLREAIKQHLLAAISGDPAKEDHAREVVMEVCRLLLDQQISAGAELRKLLDLLPPENAERILKRFMG